MSPVTFNLATNEEGAVVTIYGLASGIKVVRNDAPYFQDVVDELHAALYSGLDPDEDELESLFAPTEKIALRFEPLTDRVAVRDNRLYYDGDEIDGGLADQVLAFLKEGEDFKPLVNFYEKLMSNPIKHSREQAYRWLKSQRLTITEDGMVIGYKGCAARNDELQRESTNSGSAIVNNEPVKGKIPYPDGATVTMPRSEVDHDPYSECSHGLHVGTYSYARTFGDHVIEVLVDPRDIVSVPAGEDRKMRVCRLVVLGPAEAKDEGLVRRNEYQPPERFDEDENDDVYEDEQYEVPEWYDEYHGLDEDEPQDVAESPSDVSEAAPASEPPRNPTPAEFAEALARARKRRQNLVKWISQVLKWVLVDGDGTSPGNWRLP